ncbi:DEAD/DEAH box helicase [Evansella cellulosilytica]|uniref:ATP-dependent RNA helicase DbpA n=1 Tax=Evansella cellulosilytica (strain ATCC 21833 / DSM 2522 / FERM P-1141 / JCM 9156 / N-4) TaxID=649639 RepID=E6TQL7_EVAC2|nr:DEAD/DEAH box helicase [Evansella cellulosilytica]ADU30528.1 DEAD/DEAH box helicase domain protein [Evansella cellulosilytica DSM 2522]
MNKTQFTELGLSDVINKAIHALNYYELTDVQKEVLPLSLENKDLIVKSPTGSGKTAAFAIPICEQVTWDENSPQALVLTPTRELAAQVKEEFMNIGRLKRIKALAIYGKQPFDRQKLELKQKTHVVVGTPGRLLDHLQKGTLKMNKIKYLVIDEADEMFNRGFFDQVDSILKHLANYDKVTSIYSATISEAVEHISTRFMINPIKINIERKQINAHPISQSYVLVNKNAKFSAIQDVTIVENPDSCIVFCETQVNVDKLYKQLRDANYSCGKIHGGLPQKERFSVMNEFKEGKFRYLVTTNLAARGIDIESISLVINYDMPLDKEVYVHRTGRTGRAGNKGKAITFITPDERILFREIEDYIGYAIPPMNIPSEREVERLKPAFEDKMRNRPLTKRNKASQLNTNIMQLYFNGGKKKKLRAADFVGTITSIPTITSDDIGVITIQERETYVDILNNKGPIVLQEMKQRTIKGKTLKVHPAKK